MINYSRPAPPLFIAGQPRSPSRPDIIQDIGHQIYTIAAAHADTCFCDICFAARGQRADRDELVQAIYDARVQVDTNFLVQGSA